MKNYSWANEDQIGVIVLRDGFPTYLDSGPEYEAAVAAGPAPYAGPSDAIDTTAPVVDLRAAIVASRFQVRAALLMAGLLDQVEAAVAQADPLTRMAWAEAVEFRRNSPTIARLAEGLGLDAKTLDDLFAAAIQIEI